MGGIGFQQAELAGIFYLDEVDMGVFLEVIEGLVLYCDVEICVNITHFGHGAPVDPALYEYIRDDLLCDLLLMDVHRGKFDQRRVEEIEQGFECFRVIIRADAFPQTEYIDVVILQSS